MRVIVRRQAVFPGHVGNPIECRAKAFIIAVPNAIKTLGPSADDEVDGARLGCQGRRPLDTPELVFENIRIDEVAAAIDGKQRYAMTGQHRAEVAHGSCMFD